MCIASAESDWIQMRTQDKRVSAYLLCPVTDHSFMNSSLGKLAYHLFRIASPVDRQTNDDFCLLCASVTGIYDLLVCLLVCLSVCLSARLLGGWFVCLI